MRVMSAFEKNPDAENPGQPTGPSAIDVSQAEERPEGAAQDKPLSPEALRALAEAQARREKAATEAMQQREINGPKGIEPTRYGDWERKGVAYDF
jgi:hypothetical protein